jgi:hypothetical protein
MTRIMHHLLHLNEADIADRILRDASRAKQLQTAWKHDRSLPQREISRLGTRPKAEQLARTWSDMLESVLQRTNYGDLSRDMKFADWLTRLYCTGAADWEDISGEGGDALGAWHALSTRGLLKPEHQDLNRFRSIQELASRLLRTSYYSEKLQQIRNAAQLAAMRKNARETVLIDDDGYWVGIPMNYGACYVFNNTGHSSNFCTGGSQGHTWFNNYAPNSPIVMVIDKAHADEPNGKWQFHTATNQLVNSQQHDRYNVSGNDERFAKLFPGLMRRIGAAMLAHQDEIQQLGLETMGSAYDVPEAVSSMQRKFPKSWNSKDDAGDEAQELDAAPTAALRDEILAMPEDLRPWLDPAFINDLNSTIRSPRDMSIRTADGRYSVQGVRTAEEALRTVLRNHPDLAPGSVLSISRIR